MGVDEYAVPITTAAFATSTCAATSCVTASKPATTGGATIAATACGATAYGATVVAATAHATAPICASARLTIATSVASSTFTAACTFRTTAWTLCVAVGGLVAFHTGCQPVRL